MSTPENVHTELDANLTEPSNERFAYVNLHEFAVVFQGRDDHN